MLPGAELFRYSYQDYKKFNFIPFQIASSKFQHFRNITKITSSLLFFFFVAVNLFFLMYVLVTVVYLMKT